MFIVKKNVCTNPSLIFGLMWQYTEVDYQRIDQPFQLAKYFRCTRYL